MATLTVRDSKTGKVKRTVDGKTGRTIKTYNSDGSVKKDYSKKSSSSSSSSKKSSSSSSSSSSKKVYASRVPIGGDESQREYSVDGKWVKEKPKSSGRSSRSSSSSSKASNKGQTAEIIMTDTKTGETTRTVQDLDSGKTISKTTTKNRVEQVQARERQLEKSNFREELNKRVQAGVSEDIRKQQQYSQIQQTRSIQGKLPERKETREEFLERTMVMKPSPVKTYDDPNKTWFGNKFDKYSDKLKTISYDLKYSGEQEAMKRDNANVLKTLGYNAGAFVTGGVVSVKEMIIDPVRTPVKTTKDTLEGVVDLAIKPSARQEFSRKAGEFGQKLQSGDPIAASQAVVGLASPEIPGMVIKAAGSTTRAVRFINKVEAPLEDYIHPDVISGKTRMPSAKGTAEIIEGYKKAEGKVVTFSPQKLGKVDPETGTPTSNPLKGEQIAGDTRKGAMGMEDGGINVAPKGQGTTYFLRMGDEMQSSQYTLNPKKWWESVKSEFQTPTETEIQTRGVVKPPKKVLDEPGFEGVKNWQKEELAGTGKVSVTKRSMIGQGELPSKTFKNERKGGKVERELGTSEYELTIPQGQEFVQSGIKKYIKVDGKKVAIREAEMVITKTDDLKLAKQQKLITAKKLIDEQRSLNSSFGSRTKYKSPLNQFSRFGSGFSSNKSAIPSSKAAGSSLSSFGGSSPGKSGSSVSGGSSGGGSSFPSSGSPGSSPGGSSGSPGSSPGGSSGGNSGGSSGGGSSGGSSFFGSSGGSSGGGSSFPAPPYSPKVPRLPSSEGFKPKSKAGYDIFIRENGKRIKANKKPIPYNMALKQGTNIVDNTVAASFELQKRGTTNVPDIPAQVIGDKFRSRKTKNALRVVEKSKNRIDTTGEKQGLSAAKFLGRFKL